MIHVLQERVTLAVIHRLLKRPDGCNQIGDDPHQVSHLQAVPNSEEYVGVNTEVSNGSGYTHRIALDVRSQDVRMSKATEELIERDQLYSHYESDFAD
jgi:hypothetical protein